ncbi:MAG: hypothetical protein JOY74_09150 [Sinobacteraceae bacterium]|nr:hypothetical protein [Nevskiaceae bacterium]MBV9725156.1 hypothetical protein [Gammaproteobacteria bacterium]
MSKRPAKQPAEPGPVRYRDRPADEGKFGDGAEEPTPALPGAGTRDGGAQRKPARRPGR